MKNTLNITKGAWVINEFSPLEIYSPHQNVLIATVYEIGRSGETEKANAQLIAEAGTVANETGKTPRQLADSNKELLEALIEAKTQIEYLHGKFQATGTGNAVLSYINNAIKNAQ